MGVEIHSVTGLLTSRSSPGHSTAGHNDSKMEPNFCCQILWFLLLINSFKSVQSKEEVLKNT